MAQIGVMPMPPAMRMLGPAGRQRKVVARTAGLQRVAPGGAGHGCRPSRPGWRHPAPPPAHTGRWHRRDWSASSCGSGPGRCRSRCAPASMGAGDPPSPRRSSSMMVSAIRRKAWTRSGRRSGAAWVMVLISWCRERPRRRSWMPAWSTGILGRGLQAGRIHLRDACQTLMFWKDPICLAAPQDDARARCGMPAVNILSWTGAAPGH